MGGLLLTWGKWDEIFSLNVSTIISQVNMDVCNELPPVAYDWILEYPAYS